MEFIGVYKLHPEAVTPFKATDMSACYDIHACFHKDNVKLHGQVKQAEVYDFGQTSAHIILYPGDMALVPTGIIFTLPHNYHLKFYSRSGNVWKKRLTVANQPAIIDSDYTQESFVLLHNMSGDKCKVRQGDAIAQAEMCINTDATFRVLDERVHTMEKNRIQGMSNRIGGLGSTGRN